MSLTDLSSNALTPVVGTSDIGPLVTSGTFGLTLSSTGGLTTALPITLGSASISDSVTSAEPNDFYTFTTDQAGIFTANLSGLTGDADVRLIQDKNGNGTIDPAQLYDSTTGQLNPGEVLAWQWERGTGSETIRQFLTAGTYYIQVNSYNNQTAGYTLGTTFTAADSDPQRFSIAPSYDENINPTAQATIQKAIDFWQNAIPSVDPNPALTRRIPQTLQVNFRLNPALGGIATGGSNLGSDNGITIMTSGQVEFGPEFLAGLNNNALTDPSSLIHELGHVFGLVGGNPGGGADPLVDRTSGTYRANTYAGWQYGELLGTYDQKAVPMTTINPLVGGEDYAHWLEEVFGNETMSTPFQGAPGALSQLSLAALRDEGWNIQINFGAAQPFALPQPGPTATLTSAVDLGTFATGNANASYSASVNSEFPDRLYKLTFAAPRALKVTLDGLTADANLRLIQDANNNGLVEPEEVITESINPGNLSESIERDNLPAGSYYLEVYPINSLDDAGNRSFISTGYNLSFGVTSPPIPPITIGST